MKKLLFVFTLTILTIGLAWAQQQIIGSYPSMNGGFENESVTLATASSISSAQTNWTTQAAGTGVIQNTGGRSGPKYVQYSQSGTPHKRLQSPTANVTAASHVVQFYYQGDMDGTIGGDIRGAVSAVGTGNPQYGDYVKDANTGAVWTKYTAIVSPTGTPAYGVGIVSTIETGLFYIDDFVVYPGSSVDTTAPNSPGTASVSEATTNSLKISWNAASGGVDGGGYLVIRYSSQPGSGNDPNVNGIYAIGNSLGSGIVAYIGTSLYFTDSNLSPNTTYWYRIYTVDKAFNYSSAQSISGSTTGEQVAEITVSTTELTGFSYIEGSGPSSEKTFTVQGSNLTANISINVQTSPAQHYEISTSSEGTYGSSLTLNQSKGSVGETTIYVRLKAGLSAGNYNNENITASSTGATDKTVTCSGTVYKPEPSNHCSNFIVASVTSSTIKLTWTDAAKTAPDGYLIKGSSVSFADISAPVDGTPESNSTLVRNVNQSVGNWTFVNLSDNTTYYFRIYPYTNNGTNINYKTDGEIPQASGTTLESEDLSAGDIAVIGYRCDDPDKFAILLLTSISAGTDVKITDNGFNDLSALATNEGTITWTVPAGGLSRGTVVTFTYDSSWTVDIGSIFISSSIQLAVSGDQLIVYQGESSSPTFIYALSTTPWVTTGTITSNTSYCPTGLENGTNCLSFTSEKDSGHFKVASYINNPANTLTAISDEDNWILNDVFVPFLGWQFSIFDYISGSPFQENGVTITITGGNANHGHNPLPPIPNPHITNYTPFSFVLNTETTNWTITMVTTSLYGAYYLNENWHTETNSGNQIVFNIILGKSRGDVEVPIILSDQDPTLPVELSAFTANINSQGGITIMWVTQSETGVNGFYVNRAMVNDLAIAERISPLIPGSNTSQQQVYVYSDKEVYEPGTYYYWLEIQDIDGVVNYYGSRSVTFGGNGNNGTPEIPLVTGIRSIYPNPFNPSATIMYELEQPANLNIEIYNNRGQLVRSFAMGQKEKGRYKLLWDGTDNSGYSCGTGIYFIKMQVGKETFVKKAALVK